MTTSTGTAAGLDALMGARVALRHRIGERDGRPLHTDSVGELTDGGVRDGVATVVVTTRRGPVVIARAAVVAVRAVPPAPPRRPSWTDVARLQSLCADAWPALVEQRLGSWRMRAAADFTARANTVIAVGDPGVPLPAALAAVRGFAAANGVPPRVLTPMGSPWSRSVTEQGWVLDAGHEAGAEVAVLVLDLDRAAAGDPAGTVIADEPDDAWWATSLGGPPSAVQRHVLAPGAEVRVGFGSGLRIGFGTAHDAAGATTGVVRAAVVGDHLHLSRLLVAPQARRTGVATALTAAAARWGVEQGARWGVLQVALANTDALAFYERLGTVEHHRYHYLVPG